jgi:hypothetical protein
VYEVRRILKAFVDGQWLADFDARLAAYAAVLGEDGEPEGRGADWTEERGTSDEERRRLMAPRSRAGDRE